MVQNPTKSLKGTLLVEHCNGNKACGSKMLKSEMAMNVQLLDSGNDLSFCFH